MRGCKMFSGVALASALVSASSCWVVSYNVQPEDAWRLQRSSAREAEVLYVRARMTDGITFGGANRLRHLVRAERGFSGVESVTEAPTKGLFVDMMPKGVPPSLGSFIWGYIALGTGFILPAYSGSSGFLAQFQVYRDGKKMRLYEYEISRKGFAWLPLLPFFWVNLITDSEDDAFRAVYRQFLTDLARDNYFRSAPTSA